MARRLSASFLVLGVLAALTRSAAADPVAAPSDVPPPAAPATPEGQPVAAPPPVAAAPLVPANTAPQPAPVPVDLGEEQAPAHPADLSYGAALRLRWVTVPSFILNIFTKKNVPLSSWGTGLELFRRKGNFDFVLSFSYQNMSPPDGNWLGSGDSAATNTNFVQFQNLALWGADISFIWHTFFNQYFGLHYGAGFGIGVVSGHIKRTYDRNMNCTESNAGNPSECTPGPMNSFTSSGVPPAVPIINLLVGADFRIPKVKGLELRVEGGFYDALFLGGGLAYAY